jgi:hypothetical protein
LKIASIISDVYNIFTERIGYTSASEIRLDNPTLKDRVVLKPLHIDAKIVESVSVTFNATGYITDMKTNGTISIVNKELYPAKYGFNITLENALYTNLPNTLYVERLDPGENTIATYEIFKEPRLTIALDWNTSYNRRMRYNWEESLDLMLTLNNPTEDKLKNVTVVIPLPENLMKRGELISVESQLSYDADNKQLTWTGSIEPMEKIELASRLVFKPTDPDFAIDKALRLDFKAFVSYSVGKTLSGVTIEDITGNDFYLVLVESRAYKTLADLKLDEVLEIDVLTRLVLSWVMDDPNELFIDNLAGMRSDVFFKKVYDKIDFFSEFREHFYNIIFLANTEWEEELTGNEIGEIRSLIYKGSPVGRGLMFSGFALKYAPDLGDVLGVNYRGSLPMGEPFEIRPVTITEEHAITTGYVSEVLSSTSWAVRVIPDGGRPLAYFEDIMPGKALGKPAWMKELPALTVSAYGNGSGVLFAPDIGTSAYESLNKAEWLNLASRAIDWISTPLEVEPEKQADLKIEKDIYPKVITARFASSGHGNGEKHAMVKITIRNSGQLDLFDLNVTETLPEGFALANGTSSWSMGKLAVGSSANSNYSVWMPAVNATSTLAS